MLLISDLDGTAIDSEELILCSYEHVIETYGLQKRSREELRTFIGTALRDLYTAWSSMTDCQKLFDTHRDFQTRNSHLVKPIPGILETFTELRKQKVKIAINTNRSTSTQEFLTLTNIDKLVDMVVCVNDVVNPKPHPEGILMIMSRFNELPQNTFMLGDTEIDVLAGKGAGVTTIGAEFTQNKVNFDTHPPDFHIRRPQELLSILS